MNGETETENGNGTADQAQATQNRVKRVPPTKTLPSDRLAFGKQVDALRAFAAVFEANGNKPVTNDEAGKIINMSGNTVVVTNGFFSDVKLLVRQKDSPALIPAPETLAYYKAHEWDPKTAGEKLKPVLERCWFAEVLVPRLRFRAYDGQEALTVLAEACAASKDYEPRLQVLLEFMVFAGVVARDGSQIKLAGAKPLEASGEAATGESAGAKQPTPMTDDHAEFSFILDARKNRKVVVRAPHDMTKKELHRIQKWMEIQLIVDDGEAGEKG
jgi:hypothetical protein